MARSKNGTIQKWQLARRVQVVVPSRSVTVCRLLGRLPEPPRVVVTTSVVGVVVGVDDSMCSDAARPQDYGNVRTAVYGNVTRPGRKIMEVAMPQGPRPKSVLYNSVSSTTLAYFLGRTLCVFRALIMTVLSRMPVRSTAAAYNGPTAERSVLFAGSNPSRKTLKM